MLALLMLFGYACIVALVTVLVEARFPALSRTRLILWPALSLPCLLFVAGFAMSAYLMTIRVRPDEIDAGAMASIATATVTGMVTLAMLVLGLCASAATAACLKR